MKYLLVSAALFQYSVCLAVAGRLLFLFRRTRKLPELLWSICLIGGPVVYGATRLVAERLAPEQPDLAYFLSLIGWSVLVPALSCGAFFVAIVFRAGERWAGWVATALSGTFALVFACGLLDVQLGWETGLDWRQLFRWVALGSLTWGAVEGLRSFLALRRQRRFGLCEGIVVNRVLLFAIGSVAVSVVAFVSAIRPYLSLSPEQRIVFFGITFVCALVWATTAWLAFFPPSAYCRLFTSTAPSATDSASGGGA